MELETRDLYEQGDLYCMYSCVGKQVGRFECSVLALEDVMSGEVHNRICSCVLNYERGGS